jgi:hypothetical protein
MHLVEPEEVGPIEGDDPRITPPRPPHRRVSVSLLFTLSVLVGLVVAIYVLLPARHNVLLTEAIARHRDSAMKWDLDAPTLGEARAWAIGMLGKDAPVPDATSVLGARRMRVLNYDAALMRLQIGGDQITYVIQKTRGITPKRDYKDEGDLRATAWRRGKFTCVAVGPIASASTWLAEMQKH